MACRFCTTKTFCAKMREKLVAKRFLPYNRCGSKYTMTQFTNCWLRVCANCLSTQFPNCPSASVCCYRFNSKKISTKKKLVRSWAFLKVVFHNYGRKLLLVFVPILLPNLGL